MSLSATLTPPDLRQNEDRARRVLRPTIFLPGLPSRDPEEFPSLAQAAARVRQLAQNRPVTFRKGRFDYPGFAAFYGLTAYQGDSYLCAIGGHWLVAASLDAAAEELRGLT